MSRPHAVILAIYVETGRRIQEARKVARLTQEAVADAIGLSRVSMSNIERGRHKILLHTLEDIARVLGVDLHDLLPPRKRETSRLESRVPPDVSANLKEFIMTMGKRLTREPKRTTAS